MDCVKSFFHDDLDADKNSEEDVKTLVRFFPSVLAQDEDLKQSLLLRLARRVECVPFIPVVVEEAIQMNHYRDPSVRGGLLCKDDNNETAIKILCRECVPNDPVYPATIRRLQEMGLLATKKYKLLKILKTILAIKYLLDL